MTWRQTVPTEPTPRLNALRADPRHRAARLKLALSALLWSEIEAKGLTVADVAARSKLSDQTVRNYFAGASEPSLSRALALDAALGRPPGWLARRLTDV
jgi:transcriptional regulator with XRE-family HTH domain